MSNQAQWIHRQVRIGWLLLAAGAVFAITGFLLPQVWQDIPFNARIVTGIGILFLGIGISYQVRYAPAQKNQTAAHRVIIAERDERMQIIRMRAASRAYWVSAILTYTGLMWSSFSANQQLPALDGDLLWFFLAAVVVIPGFVYIGSMVYDQSNT